MADPNLLAQALWGGKATPSPNYSSNPNPREGDPADAVAGTKVNPVGWDALLANTPPSQNIDDRRVFDSTLTPNDVVSRNSKLYSDITPLSPEVALAELLNRVSLRRNVNDEAERRHKELTRQGPR